MIRVIYCYIYTHIEAVYNACHYSYTSTVFTHTTPRYSLCIIYIHAYSFIYLYLYVYMYMYIRFLYTHHTSAIEATGSTTCISCNIHTCHVTYVCIIDAIFIHRICNTRMCITQMCDLIPIHAWQQLKMQAT